MKIIISHNSALEYWRLHGDVPIDDSARLRRTPPPANPPNIDDITEMIPKGLSYPIDLVLRSQNAKRKSKMVKPHIYTGPTPDGSFVSIGNGVAVSAPSFCFFQMAGELPLVKLVQLGLELCGTYSLPVKDEYSPGVEAADNVLYGQPQLTNTKALKAFATRMEGVSGQKKVSRALRYIADGSASPMETKLFLLLTLPYQLGGYGLPAPKLNRRIEIVNPTSRGPGKAYYVCDFFWEKENVAVEYDSESYHSGADRMVSDARKRFDLEKQGINVTAVTGRQIRNVIEFESFAKLIAKKLGRQLRFKNPQFHKSQRDLFSLLK